MRVGCSLALDSKAVVRTVVDILAVWGWERKEMDILRLIWRGWRMSECRAVRQKFEQFKIAGTMVGY